jgi:hypothetical protein
MKYLMCSIIAASLVLTAQARPKDEKDKYKDKYKDKDHQVYSVPDTGSTALLLGTAVLVLGVASRRFATR